jgi:hypothetical protein
LSIACPSITQHLSYNACATSAVAVHTYPTIAVRIGKQGHRMIDRRHGQHDRANSAGGPESFDAGIGPVDYRAINKYRRLEGAKNCRAARTEEARPALCRNEVPTTTRSNRPTRAVRKMAASGRE